MSDIVINGIFLLSGVFLGGLISQLASFFRFRQERLDKYLLVLLEKKIKVNQQAYLFAEELKSIIHTDEDARFNTIRKIQEWYNSHNLLLNPSVRKVFKETVLEAGIYYLRLEDYRSTGSEKGWEAEETKQKRSKLEETFKKITSEIQCQIEQDIDEGYWRKIKR